MIVPKKKLDSFVGKINMNIENFTWGKCLSYPAPEDRLRYCDVLFQSKTDLKMCKVKIIFINLERFLWDLL